MFNSAAILNIEKNRDMSVTVLPIVANFGVICLRKLIHLQILSSKKVHVRYLIS